MDRLENIFNLRREFMEALSTKLPNSHPSGKLDLSKKSDQQFCRDLALRGVEEMFEALQHLKNWKPHRVSDIPDFNRDEFLEEVVDAFNYFFSLVILAGYDENDFYSAYLKKDKIIHKRLNGDY